MQQIQVIYHSTSLQNASAIRNIVALKSLLPLVSYLCNWSKIDLNISFEYFYINYKYDVQYNTI